MHLLLSTRAINQRSPLAVQRNNKNKNLDKNNLYNFSILTFIVFFYFFLRIYIYMTNEIRMLVYIKEISKKRTKRIFHNILVLTFSLLLHGIYKRN